MKVAYVTSYDVSNVRKVNGAGHYIAECLSSQSISLEYINAQRPPLVQLTRSLLKARELLHRRTRGTTYVADRSRLLAHVYSRQLQRSLARSDAEIVFSPICPGSPPTSYLETDKPIVIWTDATFAGLLDFYPGFSNLAPQTIRDGIANERAALERCRMIIFSSDWAAQTAISSYGLPRERIRIVPLGPYMRGQPRPEEVRDMIVARHGQQCRLLFLGRDWYRKGGDVAVEIARELRAIGVDATLTVAGCHPPPGTTLPEYVRVLGYLSKSDERDERRMRRLLAESHVLLVPTRADCAPAAVREAGAYGLPCITTDVGGLPTLIRHGRNGQTFPRETDARVYAHFIAELFSDERAYQELARSTLEEYQTRLNWSSAGRAVRRLLSDLLVDSSAAESTPSPARARA